MQKIKKENNAYNFNFEENELVSINCHQITEFLIITSLGTYLVWEIILKNAETSCLYYTYCVIR